MELFMEANLNAIGIIIAPIFAIIVSLLWGTKYDEKRFLKAILISLSIILGAVIFVILLPSDLHLSFAYQLFVPLISLFPILWFVEKKIIKYSASLILLVLAIVLSIQYEHLTHRAEYSLDEPAKIIALNNLQRIAVNMALYSVAEMDINSYPEGWLSESPLLSNLSMKHQQSIKEHCVFDRSQTYRLWHSPFTRIYDTRKQYLELWYPGGKLSGETIGKISLRERYDIVPEPHKNEPHSRPLPLQR
jgi:hypothetical protein